MKKIKGEKEMPSKIKISIGEVTAKAELSDTPCAQAIANILPIEARPKTWGDEFYFTIPVSMPLDETATTHVAIGDIGFWPPGNALAIFFGPTPMSNGLEPVPASEVNLVGKIIGDATALRKVKGASKIKIEKISEK
ncbi:MAG: cyclophilin-like fold protein [Syntrophorhabdus sp.]